MSPDNLYKYIYLMILILLGVGYILLTGLYLKYKFSVLFYIRMSILTLLFYILSDNLLYTILFTIFILISVNIYHNNSRKGLIEHFYDKEEFNDFNETLEELNISPGNLKEKLQNEKTNENITREDNDSEMATNSKTIEDFYEYSDELIKSQTILNDFNSPENMVNKKVANITTNLDNITNLIEKL